MNLEREQIQRVIDSYSVGNLESYVNFGTTPLLTEKNLELTIYYIKTTHGAYCMVGGLSSEIVPFYAKKSREDMIQEIADSVGLKNSEFQLTQPLSFPETHKFDYKFFLFKL